jgi:hypothetical protein
MQPVSSAPHATRKTSRNRQLLVRLTVVAQDEMRLVAALSDRFQIDQYLRYEGDIVQGDGSPQPAKSHRVVTLTLLCGRDLAEQLRRVAGTQAEDFPAALMTVATCEVVDGLALQPAAPVAGQSPVEKLVSVGDEQFS